MYVFYTGRAMRHNYLNNRDILKEIHKSKSTYCSFQKAEYAQFDLIVHDISEINKKAVTEARKNRADRLARDAYDVAVALAQEQKTDKPKQDTFAIKHTDIDKMDLIFRVMTWDHIPIVEPKKVEVEEDSLLETEYDDEPAVVAPTKYVKVNFPPFQHWKFKEEDSDELACVGKSHWMGGIKTGKYSRDHGAMTNKLALMFMKLCERYATRSNWRGYTYNDEMRSQALLQLSQIGLQFDESKSQNPFAYYTAAITNSFTRVLNIEKRNQNLRDDILQMNNLNPSYTRQNEWSGGGSHSDD
jgi:hypothetical protein